MALQTRLSRRTFFWIIAILVAAVALRIYAIDRLPPGLFGDEAVEGLDALDVLAGNWAIWFHAHLGREPIFVYLVALAYAAWGVTPLATRMPAIIAGILTVPATYLFSREWARHVMDEKRATRIALLTTALIAVSFWHIQMTRDAHRDTLLPLVEAIGFWLLWRGIRIKNWKAYAAAGAVLGLAIYTYSPGRFVSVLVAVYLAIEFVMNRLGKPSIPFYWRGLLAAAVLALAVMLPLGVYFAQNLVQFGRRFESVSVLDAASPAYALGESIVGNLAQFVVPGAGYQSKHYNLPGKPIFDILLVPWFLAGLVIAARQWRQPVYRFLLVWFAVMMTPSFVTADMIPKAVRALGIVPGVFVFPALAMDAIWEWAERQARRSNAQRKSLSNVAAALVLLSIIGSTIWTMYDYFLAWANMPELPLAFDSDLTEVSAFLRSQPFNEPVYISTAVYRPPTEMLLGRQVPTSRYVDRATRIKEFDAQTTLLTGASNPIYIFVQDKIPPAAWLDRVVPGQTLLEQGSYFRAYQFGAVNSPQHKIDLPVGPLLRLAGYSSYTDEPGGLMLYWQVVGLPGDRQDIQATVLLEDAAGKRVTQERQVFGVPPLEWGTGDTIINWHTFDMPASTSQFKIQMTRGDAVWASPMLPLR